MSAPWWYSGDEGQEPGATSHAEGGTTDAPRADEPTADEPAPGLPVDWTVLAAGAQRLVEWATERVMAPHADHDDPADHPQCVVCRTLVVIGDRTASSPTPAPAREPSTSSGIVWIPIVEESTEP